MFANMKVKMKRSLSKHLMGKEEEPDLSFIDGALTLLLNLNEAESNRVSRACLPRLPAVLVVRTGYADTQQPVHA